MTIATRLEVLDPTVAPIPAHAVIAPRPKTLDGTVVGLLANGKRNADQLLELVHDILSDRYQFKGVVVRTKGNAFRPCPQELMDDLARRCDLVVTASGD